MNEQRRWKRSEKVLIVKWWAEAKHGVEGFVKTVVSTTSVLSLTDHIRDAGSRVRTGD